MFKKICKDCNKVFIAKKSKAICCSHSCANKLRWKTGVFKPKPKTGIFKKCLVCGKEIYVIKSFNKTKKFCSWQCLQKYGKPWFKGKKRPNFSGENHPNWIGGKFKDSNGYILVIQKNHPFANNMGYVHEHRLIMEKHLGRFLKPTEIIHHINKIITDNRVENLQLFNSNYEHLSYHKHLLNSFSK